MLVFLGLVFGGLAPTADWHRSRALWAGVISASVFTLSAIVSYAVEPDWMWMYYVDPNELESAVWAMPVAYLFCFALSFAAAVASKSRPTILLGAVALSLLFELGLVALTWDRYHLVGSRAEWLSGRANELFSISPQGSAATIGLFGPVFVIVTIVCFVVAWRSARAPAADR